METYKYRIKANILINRESLITQHAVLLSILISQVLHCDMFLVASWSRS